MPNCWERITRTAWGLSTTENIVVPNSDMKNPLSCIFLGPNDESGGCTIAPQSANSLGGGTVNIGPKGPLYFPGVTGPLIISPFYNTSGSGSTVAHTIDLILKYGDPPHYVPARPPLHNTGSFVTSAGAGGAVLIPTFGRKQVSVILKVGAQAVADLTLFQLYAGTTIQRTIWHLNPGAASTVYTFGVDPTLQPDTPATGERMMGLFDMLGIQSGVSAGGASAVSYEVIGVD